MIDRSSELLRWVRGKRAATQRSAGERRCPPPAEALRRGLELWDLHPELFDRPADAVRRRELERARAAWARLRRNWRGQR